MRPEAVSIAYTPSRAAWLVSISMNDGVAAAGVVFGFADASLPDPHAAVTAVSADIAAAARSRRRPSGTR